MSKQLNDYANLCRNYKDCNFAHVTDEESLKKILESKSILGRATWDFEDTQEYILGLEIVLEVLKKIDSTFINNTKSNLNYFLSTLTPKPTLTSISYLEIVQLIERVIHFIDYELKNYLTPKVKVYVSSFLNLKAATRNNLKRMTNSYGNCIINFHHILGLLSYSRPRPLTNSLLSRVTYNKYEFKNHLNILLSFHPNNSLDYFKDYSFMFALLLPQPEMRLDHLCGWLTERLCIFAPNIKDSNYAYENEWRLKSVTSSYTDRLLDDTYVSKFQIDPSLSNLGMPATTSFNDSFVPKRVMRQLTIKNTSLANSMFITNKVEILSDNQELKLWVEEWKINHALPTNFEPIEFLKAQG